MFHTLTYYCTETLTWVWVLVCWGRCHRHRAPGRCHSGSRTLHCPGPGPPPPPQGAALQGPAPSPAPSHTHIRMDVFSGSAAPQQTNKTELNSQTSARQKHPPHLKLWTASEEPPLSAWNSAAKTQENGHTTTVRMWPSSDLVDCSEHSKIQRQQLQPF